MQLKHNIFIMIVLFLAACAGEPEITDEMVDSGKVYDLTDYPINNLVSVRIPHPTEAEKNIPVLIAAHGYSATTFEWDELREYADDLTERKFNVSQVLLGGHGSNYEDFKQAGWKEWQASIIEEYRKLEASGFKNIYLAGSSTACPLIINLVKKGEFNSGVKPGAIFLIDPIIVSSNKTLTLVSAAGPVLGYTTTGLEGEEIKYWYNYRPYQSLKALMELIDFTRKDLQQGITLPQGTGMKTYKTTQDNAADPVSAVLIYKGMHMADGSKTEVEMIPSKLHVFTRLRLRDGVTADDRALQLKVFDEMTERMSR